MNKSPDYAYLAMKVIIINVFTFQIILYFGKNRHFFNHLDGCNPGVSRKLANSVCDHLIENYLGSWLKYGVKCWRQEGQPSAVPWKYASWSDATRKFNLNGTGPNRCQLNKLNQRRYPEFRDAWNQKSRVITKRAFAQWSEIEKRGSKSFSHLNS